MTNYSRRFARIVLAAMMFQVASAEAQGRSGVPPQAKLEIRPFVGLGSGPTTSATWGLAVGLPLTRLLSVRAEYSRWGSGVGVGCDQIWPASYSCDVEGAAGLVGILLGRTANLALAPDLEASIGLFGRDFGTGSNGRSLALAIGAGVTMRVAKPLGLRLGVQHLRATDANYRALMGSRLNYSVGTLGLVLYIR
jgi:hypothetical protein